MSRPLHSVLREKSGTAPAIRIEPTPGHPWFRQISPDGVTVVPRFKATVDLPGEARVTLEVEVDSAGQPRLLRSLVEALEAGGDFPAEVHKKIPNLLRQVTINAMLFAKATGNHEYGPPSAEDMVDVLRNYKAYRPRRGLPPAEEIVAVYRAAEADGTTPANAIMDKFQIAHSTAHRWINKLKKQGELP